jgi:hypothetical protein
LTGLSSPQSTSSAHNAVFIASSNPAVASFWASRLPARATNPADTSTPSSAWITIAVRSTGTLPSLPSTIAAALRFGPYDTVPGCPHGGTAVVTVPQPHRAGYRTGQRTPTHQRASNADKTFQMPLRRYVA